MKEQMTTKETVGSVTALWRFPVKSMRGERIEQAEITRRGLVGDRAYALIEANTGKVVSAKSVRHFPDLLGCRAEFVEPPQMGRDLPSVRITLPDGTTVRSDSDDVDRELSAHFRREVRLASTAPDDFTIDMYLTDIEGADPAGRKDTVVDQKLGSAYFEEAGRASPVPAGAFFDAFPLSVLTTSTLERLNELQPKSRFDERRFRMNVIVASFTSGFVENDWVGRQLVFGGRVQVNVAVPDVRCVMTTLAQEDLPVDSGVLRALVEHNRLQVADARQLPCAGVYAVVAESGMIRTGDLVALI
jgi:MOSC domain-containing protein